MKNPQDTPIRFEYAAPDPKALQKKSGAEEILEKHGIVLGRCYFKERLPGTEPRVFARAAIVERLYRISSGLGPGSGLYIFDAFRSHTAQLALFDKILAQIQGEHPDWTPETCDQHARKFVALPDGNSVPPHNSGGAIDLTLHKHGAPVLMGGDFDEPSDRSRTTYYEREFDPTTGWSAAQWTEIQGNRRTLFHAMRDEDFVNYSEEWWHYDLGDRLWAQILDCDPAFSSLEPLLPPSQ